MAVRPSIFLSLSVYPRHSPSLVLSTPSQSPFRDIPSHSIPFNPIPPRLWLSYGMRRVAYLSTHPPLPLHLCMHARLRGLFRVSIALIPAVLLLSTDIQSTLKLGRTCKALSGVRRCQWCDWVVVLGFFSSIICLSIHLSILRFGLSTPFNVIRHPFPLQSYDRYTGPIPFHPPFLALPPHSALHARLRIPYPLSHVSSS
ncbi:hypothetical protein BDZ97DRAFT_1808027 [Flammula alnicola]|nr:hypothetical protein BDZ97DRAFT_1808027 [Flammula alnicola]